jgi:hypothetical protein
MGRNTFRKLPLPLEGLCEEYFRDVAWVWVVEATYSGTAASPSNRGTKTKLTDDRYGFVQVPSLYCQQLTPPWWEQAPLPVAVLAVPSLHVAPIL